jgi:hypothetical protein
MRLSLRHLHSRLLGIPSRVREENPGMSGKKGTANCISTDEHSENGSALPVSGALV